MFVPAGVKVHLAPGYTDMRKGVEGLAMLVPEAAALGFAAVTNAADHRAASSSDTGADRSRAQG
jgi:hypothetical protein